MVWLILSALTPVIVAWRDGSTYRFAVSVAVVGLALYFLNARLVYGYISRRAPGTLEEGTWEATARTGVVPRWVSLLGLIGMGLIPAGAIVALLLALGLVEHRGA